ncbi:MAG: AbrB family transcriptional regulator [Sedimentibacter sp.]|uniref:AbrB family transcriptional regulator n=1 Tax=Sedimentibacter sp. TaxID=1960295 RepID=UPI003158C604
MINFLLTITAGTAAGYVLSKFKVPGGMMIGSIAGAAALNIATGMAYMPYVGRLAAQIIAGAFIGVGLEKSDLARLKTIYKPASALLLGMLILNIISGFLIYRSSSLDLTTSLMSAVPGGISDIPIISEEMGADSASVALLQFVRLVFGLGVFPSMISKVSNWKMFRQKSQTEIYKRTVSNDNSAKHMLLTLAVAGVFGTIGKISGMPSAALVFSMVSVIIFKLTTGKACMPRSMRRFAQVLAGCYIGSSFTMNDAMELKNLVVPSLILLAGYFGACFIIGNILNKKYSIPIDEAMLATTPAGASDMALISAEIGIESSDVIVLQIIRMISAVSVFPQVIRLIVALAT